jgi:regulatory protein
MSENKELEAAKKAAFAILAYADNTETRLREKLRRKGYSEQIIDDVTEQMRSYGYLNEERYIKRAAEQLCNEKFYGRRRVYPELRKKGFSSELISSLDLSEFDFEENCKVYILKKYSSFGEKEYAAMLRRGYSSSEIKAALRSIKKK